MADIVFREAVLDDADAISDLILDSQREYYFHEYTPAGQELMTRLCGREALRGYVERGDVYFVAENQGAIVGIAGIRGNEHLAHNFVQGSWHRRGISKRLWRMAKGKSPVAYQAPRL